MSINNEFKKLNYFLSQGLALEFNELLNRLKYLNKINDEIFFKYQGVYCLNNEKLDLAEANLKKTVELNDSNFDNHLNLAVCYLKKDKNDLSLKHFKKSLELKNDYQDTYVFYSRALIKNNKVDKAIKLLSDGIGVIQKNNSKLVYELAEIYRKNREFLQAITKYNQILKTNPKNHILYNSLAVCYEGAGETVMAKQSYLKALNIKPNYFEALSNFGNLLVSIGEKAEALKKFEECLKFKSNLSKIFRYISILHIFNKKDDEFLQKMHEYEDSPEFAKDKDKHELLFALSKAYEDLGDVSNFEKYLILSNNSKRKVISDQKLQKELNFFRVIEETFIKNIAKDLNPELDGSNIILIIGMPRSGTTLVEQILGSHNKVKAGGEQIFFQNILKKNFDFYDHNKFEKDLKKLAQIKDDIGKEYMQKIREISDKKVTTDKLPFNFFYIGFFLSIFKNIKIVNLSRDPIDNCFSIYKNYFPEDINFAYNQVELANYYKSYQNIMKFWNSYFQGRIFNLKYEELIENQKTMTEKLLEYCKLDWDDKCLDFHKSNTSVKTLSTAQVRRPIYKSSIKSWEKHKDSIQDLIRELSA